MNPAQLLDLISRLQSTGDKHYHRGLFSSQRFHTSVPYQREDDNIFFSTLVAFTLQRLMPLLGSLQPQASSIIEGVLINQPYYRNALGKPSFNFWKLNPSRHFPNGYILRHLSFFELADDADDSAMVHLTADISSDLSQLLLQQLEQQYQPGDPNSDLTPAGYQDLKGYPTFFGKKIKREMDACVLANVLYLIMEKGLPWTSMAEQSLLFLIRTLERRDYLNRSFAVSPHYGNPAVIYYHITRLATAFPHSKVGQLKAILRSELDQLRQLSWNFMEQVLITSSSLRLGLDCEPIEIPTDLSHRFKSFGFFQAGMLTAFQNKSLRGWTAHPFFHLKFRCEAYYYTLLLECLILSGHSKS